MAAFTVALHEVICITVTMRITYYIIHVQQYLNSNFVTMRT